MTKEFFKDKFIEISYDETNKWIYNNWQDYQTMESIMVGGNKQIEAINLFKCSLVLNDNRLVKGTWTFAMEWINNDWFPRLLGAGVKRFALIQSPDIFSKFSADKVGQDDPNQVYRTFKDIQEAQNWLKS
jgi:hypothetical protein